MEQINDRLIKTTKENDLLRKENEVGETPLFNSLIMTIKVKFCDFNDLI